MENFYQEQWFLGKKCYDRSMEVYLPAHLGNYDRPTDKPTDRVIVSLPMRQLWMQTILRMIDEKDGTKKERNINYIN